MSRREQPAELHMPIPIPTPSSSSSSSSTASTAAAALGRRLSRDMPTFNASGSLFQRRTSSSKPPRTPSPRSNPIDGQQQPPMPSTSTGLTLHTGREALVGGPVAPASPPFVNSPEQAQATPVDEDGIIRVDTRTRSLSNALNLPASPPTPAPSPIPRDDAPLVLPSWHAAHLDEDDFLRTVRTHYMRLGTGERQRFLAEILNISETEELRFVNAFVRPRLKVDFLKSLPMEVALRVFSVFRVGFDE
jgi:hypothetical protein